LKEVSEAEAVNPDYIDLTKTDQLVSSWISGAVSENILSLIIGLETSYEVWQTLLNRFTQKSAAREFELRGKLQACQKHDRALSIYLREYKSIRDQLNAIGKPVDDITKLLGVLEGLGVEYKSFRTIIYCLKPQPEYDEVIAPLERFESRMQNYSKTQFNSNMAYFGQRHPQAQFKETTDGEYISQNSGFVAQRGNYRGGRSYGRGCFLNNRGRGFRNPGDNLGYRSSNTSYMQENQRTKPYQNSSDSGFTSGFRPYAGPSQRYQEVKSYPSNLTLSKSVQDEKATSSIKLECQICKKPGHDALHCWYRFDNSYQAEEIPTALAAIHLEDAKGSEWYPDTGATAHITANSGILHNSSKYTGYDTVMIGDGSHLSVTCTGDTLLHTGKSLLPLNDVLIVPDIISIQVNR